VNSKALKATFSGIARLPSNWASIARGIAGVSVMVGVCDFSGVGVTEGVSVMVGVKEIVGVSVMLGVIVGVGDGG